MFKPRTKMTTLIMFDIEAYGMILGLPFGPSFLHWMVTNIPAGSMNETGGNDIASYVPPGPPGGK